MGEVSYFFLDTLLFETTGKGGVLLSVSVNVGCLRLGSVAPLLQPLGIVQIADFLELGAEPV